MSTNEENGDDARPGFFFEDLKSEVEVTTNYVSATYETKREKTADVLRADLDYGPKSTISRYDKITGAIQRQTRDIQAWEQLQKRSQGPTKMSTDSESQPPLKNLIDRFLATFGSALKTETGEIEGSVEQVITLAKLIRLSEQRARMWVLDASALATFVRELNPLLDIGAKYHGIEDTDGGEELRKRIEGTRIEVEELAGRLDIAAGLWSEAASNVSGGFATLMKSAKDEYKDKRSRKQFQSIEHATIGKLNGDIEAFCLVHEIASQDKACEESRSPRKGNTRKSRSSARPPTASKSHKAPVSEKVSEAERRIWRVIRTVWEPTADDEDSKPKEWIQIPDSDTLSASSGGSPKTSKSGSSSVASSRHAKEYKHVMIGQKYNQPLDESSVDYGTTPLIKPGPNIHITGPIDPFKEPETTQEMEEYMAKMRGWFRSLSGPDEKWEEIWKGSVLTDEPTSAAAAPNMASLEDAMQKTTLREDLSIEDDKSDIGDVDDVDEIDERYRMHVEDRSRR